MPAKFRLSEEAKYASLGHSAPIDPPSLPERLYGSILSLRHIWREVLIVCLSILCTGLLVNRILSPLDGRTTEANPEYDTNSDHDHWIQFQWTTGIYSSSKPEDFDAVNKAWEEVIPAYGFVAVDHGWAVENHLPASMSLPSDSSKGVYILDAYHQIHCLTIIRRTLLEIRLGMPPKLPLQHSWHCFDSLLQYIVCGTSGDTLLYTWGRNQTGDGQARKCLDWRSRREWVRQRTACYKDSQQPIRLVDHFTRCEDGEMEIGDGIRLSV